MKKLFLIAAVVAALSVGKIAPCQPLQQIIADTPASQHYSGPGDVTAFTAWWGLRAYSAAIAATGTQNALDLRRASDNATCTAKIGTSGALDLTVGTPCNGNTQTVTAWVGASTALVSKIYDQTAGNACGGASCDLVQATSANQPTLLLTGCGGGGTLPCLKVIATTHLFELLSANNFTPAGTNLSLSAVGNRSSGTQACVLVSANSNVVDSIQCNPTANNWLLGNSRTGSATDNAWHAANGAIANSAGTSTFNVDGTETTSTSITVNTTAGKPKMIGTAAFATLTALVGEAGFKDGTTWSAGQRTALCHNQFAYWATATSC